MQSNRSSAPAPAIRPIVAFICAALLLTSISALLWQSRQSAAKVRSARAAVERTLAFHLPAAERALNQAAQGIEELQAAVDASATEPDAPKTQALGSRRTRAERAWNAAERELERLSANLAARVEGAASAGVPESEWRVWPETVSALAGQLAELRNSLDQSSLAVTMASWQQEQVRREIQDAQQREATRQSEVAAALVAAEAAARLANERVDFMARQVEQTRGEQRDTAARLLNFVAQPTQPVTTTPLVQSPAIQPSVVVISGGRSDDFNSGYDRTYAAPRPGYTSYAYGPSHGGLGYGGVGYGRVGYSRGGGGYYGGGYNAYSRPGYIYGGGSRYVGYSGGGYRSSGYCAR
jgi:hypothetical protein